MDRLRALCALLLWLLLLIPAGCRDGAAGGAPAEDAAQHSGTEQTDDTDETAEAEGAAEDADPSQGLEWPEGERTTMTVDGEELPAVIYHSDLGYSITYPIQRIGLIAWEGGETYSVSDARGSYLAVSRVDAAGVSQAVERVQFLYAVEADPTGYLFGADSYAGVRMVETAGGLTMEFMLAQQGSHIFLVERALFDGGEEGSALQEAESTLQAVLDTFTID